MENTFSSLRERFGKPIPGYEGAYFLSLDGHVYNRAGRILREFPTSQGVAVELRHLGQREKVLLSELYKRLEKANDESV